MFTINELLLIGLVLMAGSMMLSTIGFGGALVSTQLLLLLGLPLPQCIMFTITAGAVTGLIVLWKLHDWGRWRDLAPLILIGVLMMPIGFWIQSNLARQNIETVRMVVGGIILAALLGGWFLRVRPRDRLAPGWGVLAASSSGILSGVGNFGGPPLVLWIHAHRWPPQRLRVSLMAFGLCYIPWQLLFISWHYEPSVILTAGPALLTVPLIALGARLGLMIGGRMPLSVLRRVVYSVLVILALVPFTALW